MGRRRINQVCGESAVGVGFFELPEAPVFYPSEEEFKDPLKFIDLIRPKAEHYGICRIVPPKSWNPPFAIESRSFSFPTKLQEIHKLQKRPTASDVDTFRLEHDRFLLKHDRKVQKWPFFCGKELDLCKLFNAVKRHGGYHNVVKNKKWREVLRIIDPTCWPEMETDSILSTLSKIYKSHLHDYEIYQSNSACGKRIRASKIQKEKLRSKGNRIVREVVSNKRDVDLNRMGNEVDMERAGHVAEPELGIGSNVEFSSRSMGLLMGKSSTVEVDFRADQVCEHCQNGAHEDLMLLCDKCDRGWHLYCLTPPLSAIPFGNWYCFDCLASERDTFGFSEGQCYNLTSFGRMADRFKKKWFGKVRPSKSEVEEAFWMVVEMAKGPVEVLYGGDLDTDTYGSGFPRSCDVIPEWAEENLWNEYIASPWNLNNFAKLNGSLLHLVKDNVPGIIVPWIYIGMLFSAFCWHYEDQCFYSVNYLHWGEPKCWYAVPCSAVGMFEEIMRKTFPDMFEAQPDLLFQLVTMLNPKVLIENNVPVSTTVQEHGNFIVTFPRSYHGGFNHGFNCAEAVNFATADWLPFGRVGVEEYRLYHKEAVLSHDELVCVLAKNACNSEMSSWLRNELIYVKELERKQRQHLWSCGVVRSSRITVHPSPDVVTSDEDPMCIICRCYLHLSAVTCSCCPQRCACLKHAEQLCGCNQDCLQLLYRYSLAELDDLLQNDQAGLTYNASATMNTVGCRKRRATVTEPGGHLRHLTKLATTWLLNAHSALSGIPILSTIEDLLVQAEQFLWGGHEMDTVSIRR
eukprot:c26816_g1_i1 orf=766-3156(-)